MCNITELGMCSSIFFILFFILYANLSHLGTGLELLRGLGSVELGGISVPQEEKFPWKGPKQGGHRAALLIQGSALGHSQGTGGSDSIIANYR